MKILKKYKIPVIIIFIIGLFIYLVKFNPCFYISSLNRDILNESFDAGRVFMFNNQKKEGNFIYAYDFVDKTLDDNDSQVRQAGALWRLSLIHKHNPTTQTKNALEKGFKNLFLHQIV